MDKTLLKNFAINARNKLRQEIINQAALIGITHSGFVPPLAQSTADMVLFDIKAATPYKIYGQEVNHYHKLKEELAKRQKTTDYARAFDSLVEEVAYTWFNRLIALRFMEVNHYLPDKMRLLSSGRVGVNEPEMVTHYRQTSLDFTDKELDQLAEWKMDASALAMEKFFHRLFIKQCNALNDNLPQLFEKTDDYAELLLTISYNDPHGVLYKLVHDIPERYFDVESESGQVEIIGWLYQYYNSERKDEVFARPKSQKIAKDDIPAVTQLFTPDWIVRYMVENSLGRLWIEKLIASGQERSEKQIAQDFGWKYYLPEAQQNDHVKDQLIEIRTDRKDLRIEEIKFIDPAMGSFHIGVYAFDVFMQLYESQGYTTRDAAKLIIENNLYGIDIDERAYQLSYFACLMRGRQYNRGLLKGKIKTNLYTITESNGINQNHLGYLGNHIKDGKDWQKAKDNIIEILDTFIDAKEYGSILQIENKYEFEDLKGFVLSSKENRQISLETVGIEETQENILKILDVAQVLSQKYDIAATNPPYLPGSSMVPKVGKYLRDRYPNSKTDLFAVFMERCKEFTKANGLYSMINQHSWMFLSSYEKLRSELQKNTIINMVHLGTRAFEEIGGEVVQTTTFVFKNISVTDYVGSYIRLVDFNTAREKEIKTLEAIENPDLEYYYETMQNNFEKIPKNPISYWVSENFINSFLKGVAIKQISKARRGLETGNNEKYLKYWFEVKILEIDFKCVNINQFVKTWLPHNKGGVYRNWYGNLEYVVYFKNNGEEIQKIGRLSGIDAYFKKGITWTALTSGRNSFRMSPNGCTFDSNKGPFIEDNDKKIINYLLGYFNSVVAQYTIRILNPTLSLQNGDVDKLPIIISDNYKGDIENIVFDCISMSKIDWDSFEASWDFKTHPLLDDAIQKDQNINNKLTLEQSYENWKAFANNNFSQLKQNEEELNWIFIEIYGLEDELSPQVSDRDITIIKIVDHKNEIYDDIKGNRYIVTKEEVIKSFISYGVGCIFGRYSLDKEGLAYAGGDWEDGKYQSFIPVKDNVVLITDFDYFEDDLVNRLVDFVRVALGEENLQENLVFMADSLGTKGTPKEVLSNYLLKDFYKDHVRTYQKRPIYWLYDSGKGNGFKALIYMHRYDQDTTGRVRIDYLHQVQKAYEFRMDNLKYEISNSKNAREIAAAEKELVKLTKQLKECKDYDEKIGHLALARIPIDLDDGVKVNYQKVQVDEKGKNLGILAKI